VVADRVLAEVTAREAVNGTRIIGVDGPSGSGKSTLARQLAAASGAPIIEIDDFVSWDNFSGWWPRFDAQVLTPLLAGQDAHYQARDWTDWYGSSLGGWKTVPWQPLIIIEGVTCTRAETVGRLAYAAWTDAPADVRLTRGLARDRDQDPDRVESLWRRWMAEEDAFFAADGTRDRADLRITTT
jgi:uridine kinase